MPILQRLFTIENFFNTYIIHFNKSTFAQTESFFIPVKDSLFLYAKSSGKLKFIERTPFPITNLYSIYGNNFAIINHDTTELIFGSFTENGIKITNQEKIPIGFNTQTIEYHKSYLFIGGDWETGPFFYAYNIRDEDWHKINIPTEIFFPGKAIDDFIVVSDSLIAVDNIVMPKYLIYYPLSFLPDTEASRIFELESNGTYESIRKAVTSEGYIGLLSGTAGGYSKSNSDHVTVIKKANNSDGFSISSRKNKPFDYYKWNDIEIVENKLYIASWEKGLGRIRIKESYFKNKSPKYDSPHNREIGKWRIRYNMFSQKRLIQILKFSENKLILIYKNKKGEYNFKVKKI